MPPNDKKNPVNEKLAKKKRNTGFEEFWKQKGEEIIKSTQDQNLDPNQVYKLSRLAWKREGFTGQQIRELLNSPVAMLVAGAGQPRHIVGALREDTGLISDIFDFARDNADAEDFAERFAGSFPELELPPLYNEEGDVIPFEDLPHPGEVAPQPAPFMTSGIGGFDVPAMNDLGLFGDVVSQMLEAQANKAKAESFYEPAFGVEDFEGVED